MREGDDYGNPGVWFAARTTCFAFCNVRGSEWGRGSRERKREILGTRCDCMNVYLMKEGRRKKWS